MKYPLGASFLMRPVFEMSPFDLSPFEIAFFGVFVVPALLYTAVEAWIRRTQPCTMCPGLLMVAVGAVFVSIFFVVTDNTVLSKGIEFSISYYRVRTVIFWGGVALGLLGMIRVLVRPRPQSSCPRILALIHYFVSIAVALWVGRMGYRLYELYSLAGLDQPPGRLMYAGRVMRAGIYNQVLYSFFLLLVGPPISLLLKFLANRYIKRQRSLETPNVGE